MESALIGRVIAVIGTPEGLLALLSGCLVGYIVGIIPVIGQGFALILLLPLAFFMRPEISFIVYASMFGGADQGGSVTSILMNIPGNVANVTTILDGYPMARSGQAGRAMGISAGCSLMGTVIGIGALIAAIPFVRVILQKFGCREYFLTVVMGMIIASLSSGEGRFVKGLISGCFGMLCSFVGDDTVFGRLRFTGGINYLSGGVPLVAFVIGLYAFSELLTLQSEKESIAQVEFAHVKLTDAFRGVWESVRAWPAVIQSSIVGVIVGVIPGLGGAVAQYASYGVAKMMARDKSTFGKGNPIGVIASEASNNARDGASMVPTLFLGIPGGPEMAILLGIFLIYGITPGPMMAVEHMDLTWVIIISLMLGNVLASGLTLFASPLLSRITILPITLLNAFTLPVCLASLYSANSEIWDFATAGILCMFAVLLKRTGYPLGPVIIGYVLAPLAEKSFHSTLQTSYYNPWNFFQSPLAASLTVVIAGGILWPAVMALRKNLKRRRSYNTTQVLSPENGFERTDDGINSIEGLLVAVLFLAMAIVFAVRASHYGLRESGLWPLTVAILMIACVAVVLVSELQGAVREGQRALGFLNRPDLARLWKDWRKLFPALAWAVTYIVLSIAVGMHVANLLCVFMLLRYFEHMNLIKSITWSLISHACIYLFFTLVFKVVLWPGIVPTIIPNLIGGGASSSFF